MRLTPSQSTIISGFSVALLALLFAGLSGLYQLSQINRQQQLISDEYLHKHHLVTVMLSASRERAINLTLMSNLDDPFERDDQFMAYHTNGARFASAREELLALPLEPEERELLRRQGEVVAEGLGSQLRSIELIGETRMSEARELLVVEAIPTQQRVFALLQRLADTQRELYQRHSESVAVEQWRRYLIIFGLLGAVAFIVALLALSRVLRGIDRTERELFEANERFNLAMRGANDGLWDWDIRSDSVYYSPRWKSMLGFGEHELDDTPETWEYLIHPDDRPRAEADIQAHLEGRTPHYENLQRMLHKDGEYRWHLERGIAVRDEQGRPYRMVGTNSDITARKSAEDALFEEKERAQVTLHSIGDAVITTDHEGRITYLNPTAERLCGWHMEEARQRPLETICELVDDEKHQPLENPLRDCLDKGQVAKLSCDTELRNRNGEFKAITASAAPIRSRGGAVLGAIMVLRDVTESREMARRLNWQARHDALTGLYNRQEIEARLEEHLEQARMEGTAHAFLYLDLDQFKLVNDTSGHLAGDELLRQLAYLLKQQIRAGDTIARLGGDEFGILLSGCPLKEAEEIADKLRRTVEEFRFVWDETSFELGVSIGLVQLDENSEGVTAVLSAADVACYTAKDLGRNRYHLYTPDDQELSRRHSEMSWVSRIRQALDENRLELYQQRIAPIQQADAPSHVEILLRMRDENGDMVPPAQFIPAAERYNLMGLVDRWVIDNTLAALREPTAPRRVAINLSGTSLGDEQLLEYIRERLEHHGIDATRLTFEITETAAITHLATAIHFIGELKKIGCRFALDDFGSGLSSFTYLKNLPVDYLKIDGSFVKDLIDDPIDLAMVDAINRVGRVMGIRTIAEFVENDAIKARLVELGVDYAQGYGIARPAPLSEWREECV